MSVESYSRLPLIPAEKGRMKLHTSGPTSQPQTATPTPECSSTAATSQKINTDPKSMENTSPGGIASTNEAEENGPRFRFVDVTEIWEDGASRANVMLTSKSKQSTQMHQDRYSNSSIVLRRHFAQAPGKEPVFKHIAVNINDEVIRNAVRACLGDYPFANLSGARIEFKKPYCELFHYRQELQEYINDRASNIQVHERLSLLQSFMEDYLHDTIEAYDEHVPLGYIIYKYLWTLFRPNSIVVTRKNGISRCYLVKSYDQTGMSCYFWGYRDGFFGRVKHTITISPFDGPKRIIDLEAVPFSALPNEEQKGLGEALIERGQKWKSLLVRSWSHATYSGVARKLDRIATNSSAYSRYLNETQYKRTNSQIEERIIIDPDTCLQNNPDSAKPLEKGNVILNEDFGNTGPAAQASNGQAMSSRLPSRPSIDIFQDIARIDNTEISDQQALLTPPDVLGFALQSKVWAEFSVESVKEIEWDDTCFAKLAIDDDAKTVLKTLVERHENMRTKFKDIVEHKGVGRVFLLHGPPGAGKTLTAETISEHVKKPLYCATSGELGTDVTVAERNLKQIFQLAQKWRAILLIDEADVFLARRTSTDILRNAFVSVFLRTLEYYQGIMILTTNRLEDFDEAFSSRIHLAIPYDLPDEHQRLTIWRNLFCSVADATGVCDESMMLELAKRYKLNGREIKNLFSTSWALVEGSGESVQLKHIDKLYALDKGREDSLSRRSTQDSSLSWKGT